MEVETAGPKWVDVAPDGRYLDAAPEALDAFGVSLDELRRHRVGDFAPHGIGPIHHALFRWVAEHGRDFGGGSGTIVAPDGRKTRIKCTSIHRVGDRFRMHFVVEPGQSELPEADGVASVLKAWREAERDIAANGGGDAAYGLARDAAQSLRDIYQRLVQTKAEALAARGDDE